MTQPTNLSLLSQRRVGVLLHISSLPSPYYVGDLGAEAMRVVDLFNTLGVTIWQTLPINMPHADNSPYQCLSAHAGNPDFISLDVLQTIGVLTLDEVKSFIASESFNKSELLAKAYQVFIQKADMQPSFVDFCSQQAHWLNDFALFLALRAKFNRTGWDQWPEAYKNRDLTTLQHADEELAEEIAIIQFTQFMFFTQWHSLKEYAASKNVYLFGDIPIFVAYDSAEVWAQPHLFKLDKDKNMSVVAGVPPDYFCATGQRWGNPHYNWDAMAADGYAWWVSRMATQSALFDMVRIDHFRGLEAAWEIPCTEETAINGQWALAPGDELLAAITQALPNVTLVAEDLGVITPEVDALRIKYNLPGMKILQFAFSGEENNPYLPHNIDVNSVVYTGTHDNDTTVGWYDALDEQQLEHVRTYLQSSKSEEHQNNPIKLDMPTDLINMALESNAQLAIIPMQDLMALDGGHRMNTPGTCTGNWHWRFTWEQLSKHLPDEQQANFAEAVKRTGRA